MPLRFISPLLVGLVIRRNLRAAVEVTGDQIPLTGIHQRSREGHVELHVFQAIRNRRHAHGRYQVFPRSLEVTIAHSNFSQMHIGLENGPRVLRVRRIAGREVQVGLREIPYAALDVSAFYRERE